MRGREGEPVCVADEVPFEVPEGWGWARLASLCSDILVPQRDKPTVFDGDIPWCRIEDIEGSVITGSKTGRHVSEETIRQMNLKVNPAGTIICSNSATIGVPAVVTTPLVTNQRFIGFVCDESLYNWYLYYLFLANRNYLCGAGTGTTQSYIARSTFETMLVPLPPLAEQRRIVARLEELMPIVEGCAWLEGERERLDARLPEALRKSVLREAVEGRLVPQDPADEPAGALLARIRDERRRLAAAGGLKFPRGGESVIFTGSDGRRYEKRTDVRGREGRPACIEDEIPFEIPEGWEWARLGCVADLQRGSGIKRSEITDRGLPCVRYGELYTTYNHSIEEIASNTSQSVFDAAKKLMPDEVVMTLTGENDIDIGRAVVNCSGKTLAFGGDLLAVKAHGQYGPYLAMAINSSVVGAQRTASATGNIIVHLSVDRVSQFLVPIPPLTEQRRIVECVRGLFDTIA